MKNAVKYWKDFLLYFTTLETYCDIPKLCPTPRGFQNYILKIVFLPPTLKDTTGILAVKSGLTLLNSSVFNVKV